jgi:hypothetical protein
MSLLRCLIGQLCRLALICIGMPVVCLIYAALTIRLGSLARLPEMTLIFAIELVLALVLLAILKKAFPRIRIMVLLLALFFICFLGGYFTGYRIGVSTYSRAQWEESINQYNNINKNSLSDNQKEIIWNKIITDPQLYYMANKVAAHNAIPVTIFLSAFLYIFFLRKWSVEPAIFKDYEA